MTTLKYIPEIFGSSTPAVDLPSNAPYLLIVPIIEGLCFDYTFAWQTVVIGGAGGVPTITLESSNDGIQFDPVEEGIDKPMTLNTNLSQSFLSAFTPPAFLRISYTPNGHTGGLLSSSVLFKKK